MFTKTAASIALAASAVTGVGMATASSASAASGVPVVTIFCVHGASGTGSLRYGDSGYNVRLLQHHINALYASKGFRTRVAEDGVFGIGTRNAVVTVQKMAGLSRDGIAGENTLAAVGIIEQCA